MQISITIIAVSLFINISTAATCNQQSAQPIDSLIEGFFSGSSGGGDSLEIANKFHSVITTSTRKLSGGLICATDESCDSLQDIPFCYNTLTAAWHTADGTAGNAITGDYVLLDGQEGNLYSGSLPVQSDEAPTRTTESAGQETNGASGNSGAEGRTQSAPAVDIATGSATPSAKAASGSSGVACTLTNRLWVVLMVVSIGVMTTGIGWFGLG